MRRYDLFIIEEEVAKAYFGKEMKLSALFSEAFHTTDPEQLSQLEKQIRYITKPISVFRMETHLRSALKYLEGYRLTQDNREWILSSVKDKSKARLYIEQNHCTLWSSGSLAAETMLFEILRQIEPYFLAVDVENEKCGWLRPIKTAVLIEG